MFVQPRFANAIAVNKPAGPPPAMSVSPGPSYVRQLLLLLGSASTAADCACSAGSLRGSGGRKALVQQTNATGSRARMVSCTCVPVALRCCKSPRRDVEAERSKTSVHRHTSFSCKPTPLLVPYAPSCAVQSIQQHTCLRLPAVQTAVLQAQVAAAPALALQHSAEQRLRCAHDRIRSYRSLCKRSSTAIDV